MKRRDDRGWGLWALAAIALLALPGCSEDPAAEPAEKAGRKRDRGEPVVVEASVDKAQVDIGDRVVYSVVVRYEDGYEVEFPPVLEQFENWLIHDAGFWRDGDPVGSKSTRRIDVTLDPGIGPVLAIPPTTIKWREEGAEGWEETVTEEITVEVVSVVEGEPEFREPLDAFELPEPVTEASSKSRRVLLVATGGAVLLLALAGWLLFRKKKEREVPALPPHELAQRELAHLDSLSLLEQGRVKEYYYRLTAILRRYIEMRFGIMAPEQTTEEFLAEMRRSDRLPAEQKGVLEEFLATADLVRYARHEPPVAEVRSAFDTAERFVKVTIAGPETEPAPSAEAQKEVQHAV